MAFREDNDLRDDRGRLTVLAQIALENATDLIGDARALAEKGRWARVVFLAQIAGEELGKVVMCISGIVQVATHQFDREKFYRRFKHHKSKLKNILGTEILYLADEIDVEMNEIDKMAFEFEEIKMRSLYSGYCIGDNEQDWAVSLPRELVSEEVARQALRVAEGRLRLIADPFGRWIEYLKTASEEDICRASTEFWKTVTSTRSEK